MIEYIFAEEKHLNKAVEFAFHLNKDLVNHSSYLSTNLERLKLDFKESIMNERLALALDQKQIIGLMDSYPIQHLSRVDISVLVDHQYPYDEIAEMLFLMQRQKSIPFTSYSFFFSKENQRLYSYLTSIDAKKEVSEYGLLYQLTNQLDGSDYQVLQKEDYPQWIVIFQEIFPDVYKSPEMILKDLGSRSDVIVFKNEDRIVGFCVLELNSSNVVIEMLGVKKEFRRKGIARVLLNQAKAYVFQHSLPREIKLIVDTDNLRALNLYFDEGFKVEFENEHFLFHDTLAKGHFHSLSIHDVYEIASWKYTGYLKEITMTPYLENHQLGKSLRGFDDSIGYQFSWNQILFGLLELYQKEDGIEIGIAINPRYIGLGLSIPFLKQICVFINSIKKDTDHFIYIQADIEHHLANHIYPKAGFKEFMRDENSVLYHMEISA